MAASLRKRIWGWYFFDWASQPYHTVLLTFIFGPFFASVASEAYLASGMTEDAADARAQSIWSLTLTLSGLTIGFGAPFLGAIADTAGRRMPWIVAFSVLFVCGASGLWMTQPDGSNLTSMLILFAIGFIGAEYALIFINAQLPSLGSHEEIGKISGSGFAFGYAGGVTALAICLTLMVEQSFGKTLIGLDPIFGLDADAREGTRATGPFVALWYAVFMIPYFLWVRETHAPKVRATFGAAMRSLRNAISDVFKRPSLAAYLGSSMFYRDALNGLYSFGGTYALLVLNWSITLVGVFGIISAIAAAIFSYVGGQADSRFGPKPVIVTAIWVLISVCFLVVFMSRESVLGIPLAEGSNIPDHPVFCLRCPDRRHGRHPAIGQPLAYVPPLRPGNRDRELWSLRPLGPRDGLYRTGPYRRCHSRDRKRAAWCVAPDWPLSSGPLPASLGETARRHVMTSRWFLCLLTCLSLALPASAQPAKQQFGAKRGGSAQPAAPLGGYAKGCLAGGIELPETGPTWQAMRLSRNRNWGHPEAIDFIQKLSTFAAKQPGWEGLYIGDISQPRGGPMLSGHRSHQIGLDIDIWMLPPKRLDLSRSQRENISSISLRRANGAYVNGSWTKQHHAIIKAAAKDRRTARIFVFPGAKVQMCKDEKGNRNWLRKVRPWWGHHYHFHVRLACPKGARGCANQAAPPPGDGCKDAEKWVQDILNPPPPNPNAPKPKPRRELVLADLPRQCSGVLASR